MSRFPLFDLARDATLAVGAYVGILREHVKAEWATVLGGSFDERVAQARARMEAHADMLAKGEEADEVSEPGECRCPSCLDVIQAEQESSPVAEAAVGEPRSGLSTPPAPAPGTNVHDDEVVKAFIASQERRGEIAAHLQDALGDNYDWAPSSLPPCAILPFFHDMHADDGTVTPGIHHGFDWDGIVYDLLREFDIRKK